MSETPQCDRLNERAEERETLDHFLEWLGTQQMVVHKMSEGLTNLNSCLTCNNPFRSDLTTFDVEDCKVCDNERFHEVKIADRYLPISESFDSLVMRYLGIDTKALEAERRALLDSLRG